MPTIIQSQRAEWRRELARIKLAEKEILRPIKATLALAERESRKLDSNVAKSIQTHVAHFQRLGKQVLSAMAAAEQSAAGLRKRRAVLEGRLAAI